MKRQVICSVLSIALLGSILPFNKIQAQDGNQKSYGKAGVDYVEGEVIAFVEGGAKALASKARTANSFSVESIMDVTEANNDTKQRNTVSSTKSLVLVKGKKDVGTLIDELEKNDNVEYAEPNYYVKGYESNTNKPSDPLSEPYYPYQWQLDNSANSTQTRPVDTNVSKVWNKVGDAKDQPVVAVLDSGVDYTHEDLKDVMWDQGENIQALKDLDGGKYGYNAFYRKGSSEIKEPMDSEIGHGTHCAGVISAQWNNIGTAGVSPNAKIMGLRFLSSTNEGTTLDIIKSYNYMQTAKNEGVNIVAINNSWGPEFDGHQLRSVDTAVTSIGKLGVISVFAAGNANANLDANTMSHAHSKYAIIVGAIDSSGNHAEFSNYGQNSVDVFAPGASILSTVPNKPTALKPSFLPYVKESKGSTKPLMPSIVYNDFETDYSNYTLSLTNGNGKKIENVNQEIKTGFLSKQSLGISLDAIQNDEEFYVQLDITDSKLSNIKPEEALHIAASISFTNALYGNQIEVQYKNSEDKWKPLESKTEGYDELPRSVSIPVFDRNWNQISTQLNSSSVFESSKSISLRFSVAKTAKMSDKGENAMFRIDDFALGQVTGPYAYSSGTSMAAPFVTGVVSLLANYKGTYTTEGIIARIKGGVTRLPDSDLTDKSISQGFIDVEAAFDDTKLVPVLDEVTKEGEKYILSGNFFGDAGTGTLRVGGTEATIVNWNKQKITFTLADGIAGQQEFVVTSNAKPEKYGHNYFNISANSLNFESYNAPNLEYGTLVGNKDYKVTSNDIIPLAMSAANEQIFRLGFFAETDEKVMEIYDIKTNKWRKGTLPQNYNSEYFEVSMTAGLTKLYLLGYPSADSNYIPTLYTYDTTNEQWTSVAVDIDYGAGLVVYQDKLLAIGGESIDRSGSEVKSESTSKVSIIDPITGKVIGNLPDLPHGNSGGNVCASGNNIMVTLGYSSQTMKKLMNPFETFDDTIVFDGKAWKNYDDNFFAKTNTMFDSLQTLRFAIGATNSGLIVTGPVSKLGTSDMVDTFTFNMKAKASWSPRNDIRFSQTKISPIMGVSYGNSFYVIGNSADKKEPILFRSTKIDYTGPTSDPKGAEEKPTPTPDPIPTPNDEKPKDTNTGDTTNVASYIGIAALAIVALLGIGYKVKKDKK